ncbi:MAG: zinc ribbon domain-containing protein [Candidatus Peregrinibacteria bacterium]
MSNLGQEADVKKGMQSGAIDYVIKANTSLEDVVKRIAKALKRDLTVQPPVVLVKSVPPPVTDCPECKKEIPSKAKFCPNCGKKLS